MNQVAERMPVVASGNGIDLLGFGQAEFISGELIGAKLGYKQPRKINDIYNRYKTHFKEGETCITNLVMHDHTGIAKKRAVRIFSVPRSAFKLCMFSNAPNRAEVYDGILDVFDRYRFGSMLKSLSSQQPIAVSEYYIKELKRRLGGKQANATIKALFAGTFDYRDYFSSLEEIAKMSDGSARRAAVVKEAQRTGRSTQTVYRKIEGVRRTLGLHGISQKNKGGPRRTRFNKGAHRSRPEYQQVLDYKQEHLEASGAVIRTALDLSVSASRINAWIREDGDVH